MMHSVERRDIVLVVDDSPETLSLLTDALEAAGATVLVATEGAAVEPEAIEVVIEGSARRLKLSYVGQIGPEELLLRIVEDSGIPPEQVLKTKLGLTLRESEVLVWLARGKANRDIGEILGLSPRTVNKHLEQIYAKIGVENRAAATALAVTALTPR